MNLKFSFNHLRRRTLLLFVVVALSAAMLPTAAFASDYGNQGRGWDPGPKQPRGYHRPAQDNDEQYWNYNKNQYKKQYRYNPRPNQCDTTYRVKRGDTLSKIANYYGVPVYQLAKANGIQNVNRIYAGQVICIPW